jgi:type VI secretion system protein ImpF
MVSLSRQAKLSPPLMFAFRSAGGAVVATASTALPTVADKVVSADVAAVVAAPPRLPERRPSIKIAVSEQLMRSEVLKDLAMLVNSIALESTIALDSFPHVRRSILNYGLPDIASRTLEDETVNLIALEFSAALKHFEPRLVPGTIIVERDTTVDAGDLRVRFSVRGDLVCNPVDVPVEFIADVELDSWKIRLERV